jgi:hypothetical protein
MEITHTRAILEDGTDFGNTKMTKDFDFTERGQLPTGNQLAAARSLLGLTQAQLAERFGMSPTRIQRGEAAGACVPGMRASAMAQLLSAFSASGVDFYADSDGIVVRRRTQT